MTLIFHELIEKASASSKSLGAFGLSWTRKRTFRVHNDGVPLTMTTPEAVSAVGVIQGDSHPDDGFCFAKTASVTPISKSGGAVDVTWTYVSNTFGSGGGGEEQTPEGGILNVSVSSVALVRWRSSPIMPNKGDVPTMLGSTDIAGIPIDKKGVGFTAVHSIGNMSVTIDTFAFPDIETITSLVGTRNASRFVGTNAGTLLYTGAGNITKKQSGAWTTVHTFLWDDNYHLRQFPDRDEDRRPKQGTTTDGIYESHAYKVFWTQPHPKLRSFNGLNISINL
jgi:hypothetical protein